MNASFLATILFALLAIGGTLVANLTCLVFTASKWHVAGVILSILAAGASYWAQHQYTHAGYYRDALEQAPSLSGYQALMERCEGFGGAFQMVAVAAMVLALACFYLGMR